MGSFMAETSRVRRPSGRITISLICSSAPIAGLPADLAHARPRHEQEGCGADNETDHCRRRTKAKAEDAATNAGPP
jgi:hypothetical protein